MVKFDNGYYPNSSGIVELRWQGIGLDFLEFKGSVDDIVGILENRLESMVDYYGSMDTNDFKFLAKRLYLGEGIMLNLLNQDVLVYLGRHGTHKNFIDKFGL